jgi:16S rRNA (guanine966-N2)-methyltransferase
MRIVGGKFRGRPIGSPEGQGIRPTSDRVRESIFDILTSRLGADFGEPHVLDLFAGTGAMGIEAISRGAKGCVFIDSGIEARALLRENVERFGLGGVTKTLRRDATSLGEAGNLGPFDLVFADPPYGQGLGEKALASALGGNWLTADALVVLEEAKGTATSKVPGLTVDDMRTYGDTQVLILIRG